MGREGGGTRSAARDREAESAEHWRVQLEICKDAQRGRLAAAAAARAELAACEKGVRGGEGWASGGGETGLCRQTW